MVAFRSGTLILDASAVISLYATRRMGEILAALPPEVTVATYVAEREALFIRGEGEGEKGARPKISLNLEPLLAQGVLRLVAPEGEQEAALAAYLAMQIRGQGEVFTGAIGLARGWGLVVDDRRARQLFREVDPTVELLPTLALIRYWVEVGGIGVEETTAVLHRLHTGAAFIPHPQEPLAEWWQTFYSG
jgi:hypothetical protein